MQRKLSVSGRPVSGGQNKQIVSRQWGKTYSPPQKWESWIWQLAASDGETPVLDIWRVWCIHSLPYLQGPLLMPVKG